MTVLAAMAARRSSLRLSEQVERLIGVLLLVAAFALLLAKLVHNPTLWFESLVSGLTNGALYALIALGYTLVYGIIELINFAHGDLFMLGTVLCANMVSNWLGFNSPGITAWLALALTTVCCMIFAAVINAGVEFVAYRRIRNAPKLAALITAVGFSFIFQNIGQLWNGAGTKTWNPVFSQNGFRIGGVHILWSTITIFVVTSIVLVGLTFIVQLTRQGKAMRAVAQDQDGARLMGINVNRTISFTFALGGAMAGVAAAMYVEVIPTTRYDAGFRLGLIAFTAAVLGGIGNLLGAVIGGIVIGLIEAFNNDGVYTLGSNWGQTVIFGILILLLVFRPEGILGTRTTEKV